MAETHRGANYGSQGEAVKWLILTTALIGVLIWRNRMNEAQLVLAQTIYGEARGEGRDGMAAVANVVMNRVRSSVVWWGNDVIGVCKAPWQFSTWNENDPNRSIIEAMQPGDNDVFDDAFKIADAAIAGTLPDITGGATHYHTKAINPTWADASLVSADIGAHLFYRGLA